MNNGDSKCEIKRRSTLHTIELNQLSFDWIVGFVWGVGTIVNLRFYIRHPDEVLLSQISEQIGIKPKIYHGARYRATLIVPLANILPQTLFQLGWTGRLDKSRKYPQGNINELEFIRGYCHTKASKGIWISKNRHGERIETPRLRVWGSQNIVSLIDQYFVQNLQTTPKKPYLHKSITQDGYQGECYGIQYQSKKEVPRILQLLEPVSFPNNTTVSLRQNV